MTFDADTDNSKILDVTVYHEFRLEVLVFRYLSSKDSFEYAYPVVLTELRLAAVLLPCTMSPVSNDGEPQDRCTPMFHTR